MLINHVMGTEQKSRIFDDLIQSYAANSSHEHYVTTDPIPFADVFIHHRINKSESIPKNSIAFVHHDLNDIDPALSLAQYIKPIKKVGGIICLNTDQEKILREEDIKSPIKVIPHGYVCNTTAIEILKNIRNYKLKKSTEINKPTTLFINSRKYLRGVKGESNMRLLFIDLDPKNFDFMFCGKNRAIEAIAGRNRNFKTYAHQPASYNNSIELYEHADLLLNLSWYEGGPANLPEAISSGTPVITRKIGMAIDLFSKDYLGFFSNYKDLKKILKCWRNDKSFADELIKQTYEANSRLISQAETSQTIDKFCEQILR